MLVEKFPRPEFPRLRLADRLVTVGGESFAVEDCGKGEGPRYRIRPVAPCFGLAPRNLGTDLRRLDSLLDVAETVSPGANAAAVNTLAEAYRLIRNATRRRG